MIHLLYEITDIAEKSLASAVILFILARIMGKKQISQLTYFDYVVGISIGSVAAVLSIDRNIPFLDGVVSMVVWAVFPITMAVVSLHSIRGRKLLDGTPAVIIQNGKIIEKNLRKSRFSINDLLEELRLKDVFNINDVDYAILETSGKISVLKKPDKQTITVSDFNIPLKPQGPIATIIIDGKIMRENLDYLHLDEAWLRKELQKNNVRKPGEVLLATYEPAGILHVDIKNRDPIASNVFE